MQACNFTITNCKNLLDIKYYLEDYLHKIPIHTGTYNMHTQIDPGVCVRSVQKLVMEYGHFAH